MVPRNITTTAVCRTTSRTDLILVKKTKHVCCRPRLPNPNRCPLNPTINPRPSRSLGGSALAGPVARPNLTPPPQPPNYIRGLGGGGLGVSGGRRSRRHVFLFFFLGGVFSPQKNNLGEVSTDESRRPRTHSTRRWCFARWCLLDKVLTPLLACHVWETNRTYDAHKNLYI